MEGVIYTYIYTAQRGGRKKRESMGEQGNMAWSGCRGGKWIREGEEDKAGIGVAYNGYGEREGTATRVGSGREREGKWRRN